MLNSTEPPLGMFDLDADGTILYYRAESGSLPSGRSDLDGCSFYDVMAAFDHAGELRRMVEEFLQGDGSAANFAFICRAGGEELPLRALIARVREESDLGRAKAVLLLKRGSP